MRWPIRYQILVPFACVMLVALLCVSLLNAYLASQRAKRQIDDQLANVARTLLESSFPLNDAVLRQTRGLSGAEFVLVDGTGRPLAASGPLPDNIPHPAQVAGRWEDIRLGERVELGEQRYLQATVSTHGRAGRPGLELLHILYPERIVDEARRDAALPPLLVGVVALGVCALLAFAIADRLSRPIKEISRRVGRLAAGEFQPLASAGRNDELGDLTSSINDLAGQLDELRRAIVRNERLAVLGQLSGGLAHHLRNYVAGARMAVQMHHRHCRRDDQESIDVALRQLTLTEEHLKRFLAIGQPDAPRFQPCDVRGLVRELVDLLEPSSRHRGVSLTIGECLTDVAPIEADADQLRQALLNLVLNAIEAAGESGWVRIELARTVLKPLDAETTCATAGLSSSAECQRTLLDKPAVAHHSSLASDAKASSRFVSVRVLDSGPGVAPAIVDRLFEPFTTTKPEGVGLGLAVARQIAQAHGGRLEYSRRGTTTCFELRLPVQAERSTQPSPESTVAPALAAHE